MPDIEKYIYFIRAIHPEGDFDRGRADQEGGLHQILIKNQFDCVGRELTQADWDHFNPEDWLSLIAPGKPCHYRADEPFDANLSEIYWRYLK
jgi:hypothetical protein